MERALITDRFISVCVYCKREIVNYTPIGQPLQPAMNHSHGTCRECVHHAFRDLGLNEADRKRILEHLKD